MMHNRKPCDNLAQDQWADLFFEIACNLVDNFDILGKAVVREGVRKYASMLACTRKEVLLQSNCKTNLETFFAEGFGFPCGERSSKEWHRHTEQELFVTVASCPYAERWRERHEIGRMFCEEFYPALVHAGTSEKAQINLGYTMLNGRDDSCRLSIYLRPANVPAPLRAQCFPAFDPDAFPELRVPPYEPDFTSQKVLLLESFLAAAEEKGNADCLDSICVSAAAYAQSNGDTAIMELLKER